MEQDAVEANRPGDMDAEALARDPQRAWTLAEEARARGEWARAARLVRIARSGAKKSAVS